VITVCNATSTPPRGQQRWDAVAFAPGALRDDLAVLAVRVTR